MQLVCGIIIEEEWQAWSYSSNRVPVPRWQTKELSLEILLHSIVVAHKDVPTKDLVSGQHLRGRQCLEPLINASNTIPTVAIVTVGMILVPILFPIVSASILVAHDIHLERIDVVIGVVAFRVHRVHIVHAVPKGILPHQIVHLEVHVHRGETTIIFKTVVLVVETKLILGIQRLHRGLGEIDVSRAFASGPCDLGQL